MFLLPLSPSPLNLFIFFPFFQVANRYLVQLRDEHKGHKFVEDITTKEEDFNRLVKQYAA